LDADVAIGWEARREACRHSRTATPGDLIPTPRGLRNTYCDARQAE
jgi:hypothetical protein